MSNTPILVGIAQLEQRVDDPLEGKEPLELMADALRAAAADADCPQLLTAAGSIRVTRGMWGYKDPARVLATELGAPGAQTCLTPFGGNFVQFAVNQSALEIQAGTHDIILMAGAECGSSQAKARRGGHSPRQYLSWQEAPGEPDRRLGEEQAMAHQVELDLSITRPVQIYPMFENALRYSRGETIDAHRRRISELWAGFSAVASENPHAWLRERKSAEEIRTLAPGNRPVSLPYPKLMNSNNNVDQAAALILCSEEKARALGIPRDRWVYPWAGTDAHDSYFASNRDNFHSSPAIRFAGRRVLEMTGLNSADLDHVDLYSCFPVAVQVAAAELGLSESRPLTVTGGLTFAGGPMNNYVMHSIARMAQVLRAEPGSRGLITANGGYLTKHAFGIYSSEPPAQPFQHADLQAEVEATPTREVVTQHRGTATVESYTVMYGAEGPDMGHISALLDDGRRAWAHVRDADVLQSMTREEFCGRSVHLADDLASF